jgi:DNA-binding transcriptional LysR family regulator
MKWTNSIGSRVKMRDLQILLAVASAGGIGKAAADLSISQPAVSQAIADLEVEFGVPFFDRSRKGVRVTPYGEAILNSARAVFDNLRQGISAIDVLADPTAGHVRVGTTPPLAAGFVSAVIAQIAAYHPRFSFELVQADVGALLQNLNERSLDLAIAPQAERMADQATRSELLIDDGHVPVASADSRWGRARRLSWADVIDEPWVLPPSSIALWPDLVDAFADLKLKPPRTTVTTDSIPAHLNLVATGRFLTMLPASTLRFAPPALSLKGLRLRFPVKLRPVVAVTLRQRVLSPAVERFATALRNFALQTRTCRGSR